MEAMTVLLATRLQYESRTGDPVDPESGDIS